MFTDREYSGECFKKNNRQSCKNYSQKRTSNGCWIHGGC